MFETIILTHLFVSIFIGARKVLTEPEGHVCSVEYHATMESCSDKFHVDIPNVV
jgi:hypothetical protein